MRNQGAVGVEPIGAAVERRAGIVRAHLDIETGDIGRGDVRRIGCDQVERAGQRAGVVALDPRRAIREPELGGVPARGLQRLCRNVSGEAMRVGQFREQRQQDRAGAGAEIGDPQRAVGRAVGAPQLKRTLDHGFGVGTRHQRRGREMQRQSPKFLDAENARDRLAGEAALREGFEAR